MARTLVTSRSEVTPHEFQDEAGDEPAGELPGQQIGSTDAATVNEVSAYLSRIVRRGRLPQKLLVVHRFTEDMIENEGELRRHPGVALVVNVDGFGDRPNKIAKYRSFTRGRATCSACAPSRT